MRKTLLCLIKNIMLLIVSSLLIFPACRKGMHVHKIDRPHNFSEVFDSFWDQMNVNYLYWDVDTTNWDAMRGIYSPLFAQLDVNNREDLKKSVQYFRQLTSGLLDNHYYINFLNKAITDSTIYPAFARKREKKSFHYPYPFLKIDSGYLDKNFIVGIDYNNVTNGTPLVAVSGTINDKILYFTCNNFTLFKSYKSKESNSVKSSLQFFLETLKNLPANIKGIIIDVRGNLGGDISDLNLLIGHFINKPLHFGYTQYKSGNGRLDYTPWIAAYVNPQGGKKEISLPIIVLADNSSASLSEAIVMAIHSLPNGVFVGENTFGATGPLVETEVYNAGQFAIPDFLSVQTSSAKFKYLNGKNYEGEGFPPDIFIPFDINSLKSGKDTQLEKAISLVQ